MLQESRHHFGPCPSAWMQEEGPCRGAVASQPCAYPIPSSQEGFEAWKRLLSFFPSVQEQGWWDHAPVIFMRPQLPLVSVLHLPSQHIPLLQHPLSASCSLEARSPLIICCIGCWGFLLSVWQKDLAGAPGTVCLAPKGRN